MRRYLERARHVAISLAATEYSDRRTGVMRTARRKFLAVFILCPVGESGGSGGCHERPGVSTLPARHRRGSRLSRLRLPNGGRGTRGPRDQAGLHQLSLPPLRKIREVSRGRMTGRRFNESHRIGYYLVSGAMKRLCAERRSVFELVSS